MNQEKDSAGTSSDAFSTERSLKSEAAATKDKLAELAQTAASAGKAQLDTGLGQAAGQVEQVAKVIDETADRLKRENHEGLAAYASQVAGSIESVANRLRNSSVDELATEARQLARSNPTLFLLGSVAVGFGLTRFLKASSRMSDGSGQQTRQDGYGSTYGDSRKPTHDWDAGSGRGGSSSGSGSTSGLGSPSGRATGSSGSSGSSTGSGSGSAGFGSSGSTGSGGLGSSTGGSMGGSSGIGSAGGTRSGTDTLSGLPAKPMFPEMKTPGSAPGGTVGGSRTDEIGGGSHG